MHKWAMHGTVTTTMRVMTAAPGIASIAGHCSGGDAFRRTKDDKGAVAVLLTLMLMTVSVHPDTLASKTLKP